MYQLAVHAQDAQAPTKTSPLGPALVACQVRNLAVSTRGAEFEGWLKTSGGRLGTEHIWLIYG